MIFPFILLAIVIIFNTLGIISSHEAILWGILAFALLDIQADIEEIKEKQNK